MSYKLYLTVVEPHEGDTTLEAKTLPLFSGQGDENLACGMCNKVIARGVSTKDVHDRFVTDNRLIVRCVCGAHNFIPSQKLAT